MARVFRALAFIPWAALILLVGFSLTAWAFELRPSHYAWYAKYGPQDPASRTFEQIFRAAGLAVVITIVLGIIVRVMASINRWWQTGRDPSVRLLANPVESLLFWIGCTVVVGFFTFQAHWFGD